jgi:hypothetical protein
MRHRSRSHAGPERLDHRQSRGALQRDHHAGERAHETERADRDQLEPWDLEDVERLAVPQRRDAELAHHPHQTGAEREAGGDAEDSHQQALVQEHQVQLARGEPHRPQETDGLDALDERHRERVVDHEQTEEEREERAQPQALAKGALIHALAHERELRLVHRERVLEIGAQILVHRAGHELAPEQRQHVGAGEERQSRVEAGHDHGLRPEVPRREDAGDAEGAFVDGRRRVADRDDLAAHAALHARRRARDLELVARLELELARDGLRDQQVLGVAQIVTGGDLVGFERATGSGLERAQADVLPSRVRADRGEVHRAEEQRRHRLQIRARCELPAQRGEIGGIGTQRADLHIGPRHRRHRAAPQLRQDRVVIDRQHGEHRGEPEAHAEDRGRGARRPRGEVAPGEKQDVVHEGR